VLDPNETELFSMAFDKPMKELEMRIMQDIVRRIRKNGEDTKAADWQINRLHELGASRQEIKNYIKDGIDTDTQELSRLYKDIIRKSYERDSALYKYRGKRQLPFEENAELQGLISAASDQTSGDLENITQSLGFAARQPDGRLRFRSLDDYYQNTLDNAMLDIASGRSDYNTVLKRAVREMTSSGLRTGDYSTGRSSRVDAAARRSVMTGLSQITAKLNEDNMDALDTEYVEVSWHSGARPSHQVWQGKVFHWDRGVRGKKADGQGNAGDKLKKAVDISGESGIINTEDEMFRRKSVAHRRIGANGQQIIDMPTYNKLTNDFVKRGGLIIRGEEAAMHLANTPGGAAYLPSLNAAVIRDDATVSDVLEEMYHAEQDRKNMFGRRLTDEVLLRREIDAQKYLLSLTDKYKIPVEEVEQTKKNLEGYEKDLEEFLKKSR